MTARLRVSILVIGDEILGGFVTDTNSGWIAGRLQAVGVPLDRIVTVPDDPQAIGEALRMELGRARPRVVLTSGGLGSTPDDVTLEAVATTLGLDLETNAEIDEQITATVQRTLAAGVAISPEHEQSMRKMSRVPAGAYVLPSAADAAPALTPGLAVDVDGGSDVLGGATIVVLPGIPSLLRRITMESVEPALLVGRGQVEHVRERSHGYPESALNPVLDRLTAEFPDVHVGSYPGQECTVRLKGAKDRVEEADTVLAAYLAQLAADPASERLRDLWQSRWSD